MIEVPVKQADYSLQLGRRGENGVRALVFDFADWVAELGPGIAQIVARRAGEETAYPVNSEQQGSTLRWIVSAADTACPGYGEAQLTYRVGGQVAKTRKYNTYTADSITWPEDVPGLEQSFLDQMLKAGAEAKAGALRSEQAASRSEQILTETAALKDQTGAACKAAETAKDEAARQAQAAANQRQAAEGAAQSAQNSERGAADEARKAAEERIAAASAQEAACSSAREAKEAKTGAELAKSGADTAAKAAQSEAEKAKLEAERAEQAANRAEGVICDDSIETKKTWSSLNILKQTADRMASPFCKKAPIVQGELVADYPMNVKLELKPIQAGAGDPSPENVRPITGRESVVLTHCGSNMLNNESLIRGKVPQLKDGVLTNYPRGVCTPLLPLPANKSIEAYSESVKEKEGFYLLAYKSDGGYIGYVSCSQPYPKKINIQAISGIENASHFRLRIDGYMPEGHSYVGVAGMTYQPYRGKTITVQLGQNLYGCTVDLHTGKGSITGQLVTPSEYTTESTSVPGVVRFRAKLPFEAAPSNSEMLLKSASNKFVLLPSGGTFNQNVGFTNTEAAIYVCPSLTPGFTIKQMQELNASFFIWYKTPTPFQLSTDQLQQLLSYGETDTLYTADPACEVDVTARLDPNAERKDMEKRIAALEAAHTPTL